MTYYIDIQNKSKTTLPLTRVQLRQLAQLALRDKRDDAELTIRLVQPEEMTALNHQYRQKNAPTNVLAFPSALPSDVALNIPFIGDVVICPQVLKEESIQLNKSLKSHWSHIVLHGILHLLGYDHIKKDDAKLMQSIEIHLLAELGFDNPYHSEE